MKRKRRTGKTTEAAASFSGAVIRMEDGVAQICRLYGINPMLGRVYAVLFASPAPLSLGELCKCVGAAKSTTSVALRRLLSLRIVRRHAMRSDRRDFYEVVSDLWGVLRDWNQSYFQPEIAMWRRASADLASALDAPDAPAPEGVRILRDRLSALDEIIDLTAQLLGGLPASLSDPAASTKQVVSIPIEEDAP